MQLLEDPRLDWSLLDAYRFDRARFERDAERAMRGEANPRSAFVRGDIVPAPGTVSVHHDSADGVEAKELGEAALARGEVAVVVLNGGMATRFGGVVKGTVEVLDGQSFLALKARDVRLARERYGGAVPLVLMNSFATHTPTMVHVAEHDHFQLGEDNLLTFTQSISVRLTPRAELFTTDSGNLSYYAPGHGDFFASIRASGALAELRQRGIRTLTFSNVDNLGATLDPVILGMHLRGDHQLSFELTERRCDASGKRDAGGAPVLVEGRLAVVEGFRFPPGVQETLPDFQTNNLLLDVEAIDRLVPMEHYPVIKHVEGREALQFESIACEASSARDALGRPLFRLGLLRVPREGRYGRFYPVKTPEDLQQMRRTLQARLGY